MVDISWITQLQLTFWPLLWLSLSVAFVPIIPRLVTDCNTINTAMVNFQDVLSQKGLDYGPLSCDKRVYRIAKEFQLENSVQSGKIFLETGGF